MLIKLEGITQGQGRAFSAISPASSLCGLLQGSDVFRETYLLQNFCNQER